MPQKPKTTQAERDVLEAHIQDAIAAVLSSGVKPSGKFQLSLNHAADAFDIPRSTLKARYGGRATRQAGHSHLQKLKPTEEGILRQWI